MSELKGLDRWLEAPYQRMYAEDDARAEYVEQFVGLTVEAHDQRGEVVGVDFEEDADEDGAYLVITLEVKFESGETAWVNESETKTIKEDQK